MTPTAVRALEVRVRLGEFEGVVEVDVYRHRAHLAWRRNLDVGEPALICGRTYRYGMAGWSRIWDAGKKRRVQVWTNLCPDCAQGVANTDDNE